MQRSASMHFRLPLPIDLISSTVSSFEHDKTLGEIPYPKCCALNVVVLEGQGLHITIICEGWGKEVNVHSGTAIATTGIRQVVFVCPCHFLFTIKVHPEPGQESLLDHITGLFFSQARRFLISRNRNVQLFVILN